ncbi:MAG: hypothetical protein ACREH3_03780, partial [Geminicoccales bacterium]
LEEIAGRLASAGRRATEQKGTHCCYAYSDKAWITDPQGVKWESFRSDPAIALRSPEPVAAQEGCCGGAPTGASGRCP